MTGGGRGIGAAVARALAGEGASVVVSARTREEIDSVAGSLEEAGHRAVAIPCDVTDEEALHRLRAKTEEALGPVDILVCNAGTATSAPLTETSPELWDRVFAVNTRGVFLTLRTFLPSMLERGWGRVVIVASIAGRVGAPYISAYCASKHAVVGLARAVAAEVAPRNVTVNAVCPGYVDTPMTERSVARIVEKTGRSPEETLAHLRRQSPQNRLMEPEEVAALTAFLCTAEARGINGQAVVLDGGMVQG